MSVIKKQQTREVTYLKKTGLIVLLMLLFTFLVMAGSAYALPTMGEYKPGTCDSCHGVGKQAPVLPQQKAAAPKTEAPKVSAPKPAAPKASTPKPAAPKAAPAKAVAPKTPAVSSVKSVDVALFTQKGKADTVVSGGVTYVSVKSMADLYKTIAEWHAKTNHFALKVKDFEFNGTVNKKEAEVNGKAVTLDQPLIMVKGRMYVPAQSFAKAAGAEASISAEGITIKPTKYSVIGKDFAKTGKALDTVNASYADQANRPGARPNATCASCHNGTAYEKGIKNSKDLTPEQLTASAQTCNTCHQGKGKGAYARGTAEIAGGWGMSARITVSGGGEGAFCADCHNSNNNPDPKNARRAYPHYGPQANVVLGNGGMQVEGFQYGTSPHAANPNSCASCHMAKDEYGYASHSFKVADKVEAACSSCHAGLTTVNRPSLGDYDGNGKIEGIQDEVKGLKALLKEAINLAIDPKGGSFEGKKGSFYYYDAEKKELKASEIPDVIYKATWNYKTIDKDGSYGIHNPIYTVQLLQQSYKELTGKDVPNAQIR